MNAPTIETHVPVTTELPDESKELAVGRPDLPVPSLWQKGVKVLHKATGKAAVIAAVDHDMCLFRAFYPDELNENGAPGRFAPRTEWESFANWQPELTLSKAEIERQSMLAAYEAELMKLDPQQLALAQVLCDDNDPGKALAKLRVMLNSGLIKLPNEPVVERAVAEMKGKR